MNEENESDVARPRLTITLHGSDHLDGEVPLQRIAQIAGHTQDLALRIARGLSGREGAGRTPDQMAGAVQLMLVGLRRSSTILDIAGPAPQAELDLGDGIPQSVETQTFQRLEDTFRALAEGDPLPDLSEPARQSIEGWLVAVATYDRVEVGTAVAGTVERTSALDVELALHRVQDVANSVDDSSQDGSVRTVEGELYSLNLHTGRYRLEDDLGYSILLDVSEPLRRRLAGFVGTRIRASGSAKLAEDGVISVLTVTNIDNHDPWAEIEEEFRTPPGLEELLADVQPLRSVDDMDISGLSEDEADAFWAALRDHG